ncbi:MAG: VWA domain-containing protein [Candidatus Sedimenticola sp. (ex Thyasira tokunagai)]
MVNLPRPLLRPLQLILGLFLCTALSLQAAPVQVDAADARILIDISGSMRQNDPKNLRRPALRLLLGLLPDEARAGVWTFGQYVNMQVPLGQVDEAWRERARTGAAKIGSPGQFTNIEEVLKRAIADWEGASRIYQRHLILLTDGMVDISKSPGKNRISRQRIIDELVPKLKKYGAKVHTIALSERADHELMKILSNESGGWYEQVNDAEQLQRIFLRIFEKVGRPDTVPLNDNKFLVDSSIEELTLLVFRLDGAEPTQVVTPSGQQFGFKGAPENVFWHHDEGYDLLTIADPEVGEWRLLAATDPDNRVMVVTNMKMRSSELPSRFVLGEQLPLEVYFTNKGEAITRKEFLDMIEVKSEHINDGVVSEPRPLFDDGQGGDKKAGDGNFTVVVGEGLNPGKSELIIRAEGKTFQREQRHRFELASPFNVEVIDRDAEGTLLLISADKELVDATSLQFEVGLTSAEGNETPVMMLPGMEEGVWETRIDTASMIGDSTLVARVFGKTASGSDLDLEFDPITVEGRGVLPPPEPPPPPPEPVPPPEPEPEPEPPVAPEEESPDWVMNAAVFGGVNLLLLIGAGVGFWFYRRGTKREQIQLITEDEGTSDDAD